MRITSNQIITIIIAFLIGVVVASALSGDKEPAAPTEEGAMEEGAMEGTQAEEAAQPPASQPAAQPAPTTTSSAGQEPVTGTQFVSGACRTNLSGYVDNKLNAIVLNWNPCASSDFQLYRLVKSSKNSNPTYPADPVAFSSSNKNAANFVDKTVAPRTTYYYRMCVVQRLNKVNCSNVATVSF